MYGVSSTSALKLDWFDRKGVYLVPKSGYMSMIIDAIRSKKTQGIESDLSIPESESKQESTVHLSKQQIKSLAQQYNPHQMNEEDYRAFIDDLCQLGVLNKEDKPNLSCGAFGNLDLIPLNSFRSSISGTPATFQDVCSFSDSFSSCNGNVKDWANFLSTFRELNPHTHTFEKSKRAILFERIADILEKIQLQRG